MVKLRMLWVWVLLCTALVACDTTKSAPPRIATPVTDIAGVLSASQEEVLAQRLAAHRRRTGVQVALLTITTLDGEPIEDFSHRTAVSWGGGSRERNDGVLVTFAVRDHRSRIEVGYGLEAELTDGRTRALLDGARPFLRRSDYAGAFGSILDGIETRTAERRATGDGLFAGASQVSETSTATASPTRDTQSGGDWAFALSLFAGLTVTAGLVWALIRGDRKRDAEARVLEAEAERDAAREERARRDRAEREERARRDRAEREERARRDQAANDRRAQDAKAAPPVTPAKPAAKSVSSAYTAPPVGDDAARAASRQALARHRADAYTAPTVGDEATRAAKQRALARHREEAERAARHRADQERRETAEREARRRRERDAEDARRRSESSSYSSSFSWGSSSSSSDSGSDSGSLWGGSSSSDSGSSWGGGGGDFGGGGSSGDW